MIRRVLGSVRYLTVLPVPWKAAPPGQSAFLFPLLGAGLGWIGARMLRLLDPIVGSYVAAMLVLAFWVALSGGRNESALARRFTFWAVLAAIAVRCQALVRLVGAPPAELAACLSLSNASLVAMAWISRPVDNASEQSLPARLSTPVAVTAIASGAVLAFVAGVKIGFALLGASILMTQLLLRWFDASDGGHSRDDLHSSALLVETLCMVIVANRDWFA